MLYPSDNVNKIINRKTWDIQKNIEVVENRALKKEELKEKVRKSNFPDGQHKKSQIY
jgi:hypothetical protein